MRKRNPSVRRDQIESYKNGRNEHSPTKGKSVKLIKDFYTTNPIETFNKHKIKENIIEYQNKNKVKCERVADYLGSSGVKSIFNSFSVYLLLDNNN